MRLSIPIASSPTGLHPLAPMTADEISAALGEVVKARRDAEHFRTKLREINTEVGGPLERARLQFELYAQVANGFGADPASLDDLACLVALAPMLKALGQDLNIFGLAADDKKSRNRGMVGALYAVRRFLTAAGRILPNFDRCDPPQLGAGGYGFTATALRPFGWLMEIIVPLTVVGRYKRVVESAAISVLLFHTDRKLDEAAQIVANGLHARGVRTRGATEMGRYREDIDCDNHRFAAAERLEPAEAAQRLISFATTPPEPSHTQRRTDPRKQLAYEKIWPVAEALISALVGAGMSRDAAAKRAAVELLDMVKPRRSNWINTPSAG